MNQEATELALYIKNDGTIYQRMIKPVHKLLAGKKAKGIYRHDAASKVFANVVTWGAKSYIREHGSPQDRWDKIFDVATRKQVADSFRDSFEAEHKLGGFDHLKRAHSTVKTAKASDLFIGTFPGGISYADRTRERNGDYLKVAFLPYDTLVLKWHEPEAKVPPAMRAAIVADARRMAARRGKEFPVSSSGQTVLLGGKKSSAHSTIKWTIRAGDKVTIVDRFGKQSTGRAVMRGSHGWVLNMGGRHGTPGIATDENITNVAASKRSHSTVKTSKALRVGGTAVYLGSPVGPGGSIRMGSRVRIVRIIGSAARIIPASIKVASKKAMLAAFASDGVGVSTAFLVPA